MKRIILCLDGTWNSTYALSQRKDGSHIIKPSNVLKFARSIKSLARLNETKKVHQIVYYVPGLGSMSQFKGRANQYLSRLDLVFGGVWGAGFERHIEDVMTFLVNNYNPRDQVFLFGFSRGAAAARALTHFIDWMEGIPAKEDVYFLPTLFRDYVSSKGENWISETKEQLRSQIKQKNKQRKRHKIKLPFQKWQNIKINFLGVWDTVFALGSRFKFGKNKSFYVKRHTANCVLHARHALAIDEKRHDFLPSLWEASSTETKSLKQRWFAGVHANIGGGYVHDGLANITFHWMKSELVDIYPDFALNQLPFKKYKKFSQDELIDSFGFWFKIKDFLTRCSGTRAIITTLVDEYQQAGLSVDFTALQRMKSDPNKTNKGVKSYPNLKKYRPANLLHYIESIGVDNFLQPYLNDSDVSADELEKVRVFLLAEIGLKDDANE